MESARRANHIPKIVQIPGGTSGDCTGQRQKRRPWEYENAFTVYRNYSIEQIKRCQYNQKQPQRSTKQSTQHKEVTMDVAMIHRSSSGISCETITAAAFSPSFVEGEPTRVHPQWDCSIETSPIWSSAYSQKKSFPQHPQDRKAQKQRFPQHPQEKKAKAILPTTNTTVVVRNFPKNLSQAKLIDLLRDTGFACQYDFLYLPYSEKRNKNLGYILINFLTSDVAYYFRKAWDKLQFPPCTLEDCDYGCTNVAHASEARDWMRPLTVSESQWQGKEENVRRFLEVSSRSKMRGEAFEPLLFEDGVQQDFSDVLEGVRQGLIEV